MVDAAQLNVALTESGAAHVISALGNVEKAVKETDHSVISLGATMGATASVVTAALSTIANVAGSAFASAGEAVIGMNSKLEQSSIAFTTMLGSAEASAAMLQDLQQFAATTPFEFPQLVDAAKKMMGLGFSAQQVRPMLTSIGDAAAGLSLGSQGIDRITLALGQMQMKGKVSAEEVNQLAEAGINAWDSIAKKIGVDVPTAMAMASKGMISSTQAIPAILEGMTAKFGGMMEAQSHTFAGALSTIKDTVGQLASGGLKPFFDVISSMADRLATFAQSETVSIWAQDLQITLGRLTPMFSTLGAWLESQLPAAMSAAEAAAHGFVSVVQDLGPKIAELAQNVGPVLAAGWEKLGAVLSPVGAALAALGGPLSTAYGAFAQLDELINGTLGAALSGLGGQLADASRNLVNFGAALSTALGGSETAGLEALAATAGGVGDALSVLGTIASTVFQDIQIAAVEAANVVIPKLEELRTWLEANLAPALATVQEAWDGFWSHAGPMVQAMWNVVQPIIGAAIGAELEVLKGILTTFKNVWDTVWGGIMAAVETVAPLVGALASAFGGAFAGLSDTITAALNSMQTPVAEAATEVGTTIKNNIVQGAAPVGAELEAAVAPAATAVANVGASAAAAAPAVASLGGAGATAAAGLGTASKEAQTLDQVMSQLAKSTTPEAVAQALTYQNATAAITEAMKSLDLETASQVQAMKNAGDVYGAADTALTALGATGEEVASTIHGLASAHDVLAQSAYRATAALRATQSAGQAVAGISAGGAGAGPTNFGALPTRGLTGAEAAAINATGQGGGLPQYMPAGGGTGALPQVQGLNEWMNQFPGMFQQAVSAVYNRQGSATSQEVYSQLNTMFGQWTESNNTAISSQQAASKATDTHTAAVDAGAQALIASEQARRNEAAESNKAFATFNDAANGAAVKAAALGEGMDFAGAAQARVAAAAIAAGDSLAEAAAQAAAAGEQWKLAIANASALMSGAMRNAGVAGGVTEKGLTYGQIYGGQTPGSSTGITTITPGNYYGLPVVSGSPITPGSLRGYADGPFVPEPSYLTSMRTGRTYGLAGEHGPEPIGYGLGGATTVQVVVNVNGADALKDPRFYEQLLDRGLTQTMQKRRLLK